MKKLMVMLAMVSDGVAFADVAVTGVKAADVALWRVRANAST